MSENPSRFNPPKMDETGVQKDPKTGSTLAASASNPKVGDVAKATNQPTISPKAPQNAPQTQPVEAKTSAISPAAAAQKAAAPKDTRPLDKSFTEIKGEILQGDSFRLTLVRDGVTFQIPVAMETTRDLYTLDNTTTIIAEILKAANRSELEEKFMGFIAK